MIARIVRSKDDKLYLLNKDGTISTVTISLLKKIFRSFNQIEDISGDNGKWDSISLDMSLFPGETMVFVTEGHQLVITDPWIMNYYLSNENTSVPADNLLTLPEYAKLHDRSVPMIKALCQQGRIAGARKMGRTWVVPASAPYPIEEQSKKPGAGRPSESQ